MSTITTDTRNNPAAIGAADGWLFGYSQEHEPMVWREGEAAEPASELSDYAGWHLQRYGFDAVWCSPDGRLHRADGTTED